MKTLEDLQCCVCQKWLDSKPMTCCERGLRICSKCFEEIPSRAKCPVCQNDIESDGHFLLDNPARKEIGTARARCKSCSEEMLLADLRGHEEDCGSAKKVKLDEHDTEMEDDEAIHVHADGELDDGRDERENENVLDDQSVELGENDTEEGDNEVIDGELDDGRDEMENENILDDQVQSCEYRQLGCQFQGTSHELIQHKSRPPLECSIAKALQSGIEIVQNQHSEFATKLQEIREMHQLLTAAAYPEP